MSAKHTPGPWTLFRMEGFDALHKLRGTKPEEHEGYFRTNDGSWAISNPDGRICLADFKGKAKRGEAWKAPDPEGMANANLIAAAPELLEVLKELVNMSTEFESVDSQKIGFLDCRNRLRASVERSLAAIARAEGGQS